MAPPISLRDARYFAPPLIASGIASKASELSPFPIRTTAIYGFEGDLVASFQSVTHPVLTQLSILAYLFLYPALLLLTYIGLKRVGGGRHIDYAITYTAVVVVSTPFFFFVPVGVTGYTLPGVEPLLYESSGIIGAFVTNIDTLQKALPSLHTGLSVTASLHAPRGYERVSWAATALIVLSTLYLGIHWVSDIVVGAGLAYGCYLAMPRVQAWLSGTRQSSPTEGVRGD